MRIRILALAALVVLTLIVLTAAPAAATIGDVQWTEGVTYQGQDGYYTGSPTVVAFAQGATVKALVQVTNDTGADIDVKSAKLEVKGLDTFTTTDLPSIDKGKTGYVTFTFTIPMTASNTAVYAYTAYVRYDEKDDNIQGVAKATTTVPEAIGAGDGVTRIFYLLNTPVVEGTITVETLRGVPPAWTATTAYTLDAETGKITFTTAPAVGETIRATAYNSYNSWTKNGTNLAVYSAEQVEAMDWKQKAEALVPTAAGAPNYTGWMYGWPAGARDLLINSDAEIALGDRNYMAGSFAPASANYMQAYTMRTEALEKDYNPVEQNQTIPSIAIWVAGFGVLFVGVAAILYASKWKAAGSS